jgi:hypothetical protein
LAVTQVNAGLSGIAMLARHRRRSEPMDRMAARCERYRDRARTHWVEAQDQADAWLRQFHATCASIWQELAAIFEDGGQRARTGEADARSLIKADSDPFP